MLFRNFFPRRDFIVKLLGIAAGMLAGGFSRPFFRTLEAANGADGSTISVITGKSLSKDSITLMVESGFRQIGGIDRFIKKNMKVVIKPNIGWNSTPDKAHNTNPDLVEAVARMCVRRGAVVTIFDRSVNSARMTYRRSGILQAAQNAGASIEYVDSGRYKDVRVPGGIYVDSLPVYSGILEADFVINMPIAKHHSSSRLTLAMKNLMGVIGGNRGYYHGDIHSSIVDFAKTVKSDLVILDATRILTAHGPNGGTPADVKELRTIVMGTNPVTVDAFAATLFNIQPTSLRFLKIAAREGMGEINIDKMRILRASV
ncbi:MAG: DUF362 domain-containing protein [Spirochaetes bacterium]|nr:DUF362 domain-containing protein [Spirochaetota bacterium]